MIRMICGAYGGKDGLRRAGSGPFSLSAKEEERLVKRGVAVYVHADAPGTGKPDDISGAETDSGRRKNKPKAAEPPAGEESVNDGAEPPEIAAEGPVL